MISQRKPTRSDKHADVCLLLEGTYPYVRGGVSSWTHELILAQHHLTFHIVCILPGIQAPKLSYELPDNVLSVTEIFLGTMPHQSGTPTRNVMQDMKPALLRIAHNSATVDDLQHVMDALGNNKRAPGSDYLLNSTDAWGVLEQMYEERYHESSMLDYFWSWRALFGSIFSILLHPLPDAGVYHTLCTGYAGLLATRAKLEKRQPVLLTEHGIYTNERRIEIASADWLEETASSQLTIDSLHRDLRDLWIDAFACYSRICYDASDEIVTLYRGNQVAQYEDGAAAEKMQIIPNGIDLKRFNAIERVEHDVPTIAMIGRVVPIKDVKSFIRCCAIMRDTLGELRAYVMGNTEEDPEYFAECQLLAEHLLLDNVITFTGSVRIDDYLPNVDVIVFTSVSEAQPLVILEAGAAGIPVVSTDVGACDEMINGAADEMPALGAGGAVVPLSDPDATARAAIRLLTDTVHYQECSIAIKSRVERYYNKQQQQDAYRALYATYLHQTPSQSRVI